MPPDETGQPDGEEALRREAEKRLRAEAPATPQGDPHRIMQELQVHQIELEMQNSELRDARSHLELLVEKYTDLYDFAPVGYFSLDASGHIKEVNLTGATMLGVDRSRLLGRLFSSFVDPASRPDLDRFLNALLQEDGKKICELAMDNGIDDGIWVDLQGVRSTKGLSAEPLCQLAVSDITALKRAAEVQRRVEALEAANAALKAEISKRKAVEKALRESKEHQSNMLVKALAMQEKLRNLSHQFLHAQEEERRRISLDLHDKVAQTLVAINLHLASLARDATASNSQMSGKILETQELVEQSVENVHRFARDLRPTVLDDLGLIPALQACVEDFTNETNIPAHLTAPGDLRPLGNDPAVAFFRIAQAALSNVAQHAEATEVSLTLRQTDGHLQMEIKDNGKGFDIEDEKSGKKPNRIGLIGMRERMEMIGGRFGIDSLPGKGTSIRMEWPLPNAGPSVSFSKDPL
ncbi:MAG: histidine kinase [Oceanipulchritudo sp.]